MADVKRRCGYITEEQKSILVDFMSDHHELTSGKFSATFTVKDGQALWTLVTDKLHEIPGAIKTWQQWRKTWQDIRSKVKAKNTSIKNHKSSTGGGPVSNEQLTQSDENVMAIMGSTVIHGHDGILESSVDFDWTNKSSPSREGSEIEYLIDDAEIVEKFVQASVDDVSKLPEHVQQMPQSALNQKQLARVNESRNIMPSRLKRHAPYSSTSSRSEMILSAAAQNADSSSQSQNQQNGVKTTSENHSSVRAKKKIPQQMAAAQRLEKSIAQTEKLAIISKKDQECRKIYYERKIELYEREVAAKEKIASCLEEFVFNSK